MTATGLIRPIILMAIFYCIGFLYLIVGIIFNRTDSFSLFFLYFSTFSAICIVNIFFLKFIIRQNILIKKRLNIIKKILAQEGSKIYEVNNDLNCQEVLDFDTAKHQPLEKLLSNLEVDLLELNNIQNVIHNPPSNIYSKPINVKNSKGLKNLSVIILNSKKYIKINESFLEAPRLLFEKLQLPYFEIDANNNIVNTNPKFSNLIDSLNITSHISNFINPAQIVALTEEYLLLVLKPFGILIPLLHTNYDQKLFQSRLFEYSWDIFFKASPVAVGIIAYDKQVIKANDIFTELFDKKANFDALIAQLDKYKLEVSDAAKNLTLTTKNLSVNVSIQNIELPNAINGILVYAKDITPQKNLEENLSHSQRIQIIGQLVGSVAHDFNNILTAISGFCDLLLLRHGIGDPSFANIMQIKQSADRASNLIKRLLAFSRKQTLQLEVVNPIDLFSEFTPLIQRLIGTRIKFKQIIDPNIWHIKVDTVQMEQIILNLVINAQQAMSKGGSLVIKVENFIYDESLKDFFDDFFVPDAEKDPPYGQYVMIIVEDTGGGIAKRHLNKIFEPFYTTKSEISGTGLGLATTYGVIKQSNAYILVKTKVGKGTSFYMLFPKEEPPPRSVIAKRDVIHENISNFMARGTIILVEDEDAIRIFAKKALVNKGYEVIEFSSALEAKQKIISDKIQFDLLFTDVIMPEMTGPSLVTELMKRDLNFKVVFTSGNAEEAFTAEYGNSRNFHFLPKPFSLKQLLMKVQEVLSS